MTARSTACAAGAAHARAPPDSAPAAPTIVTLHIRSIARLLIASVLPTSSAFWLLLLPCLLPSAFWLLPLPSGRVSGLSCERAPGALGALAHLGADDSQAEEHSTGVYARLERLELARRPA